MTAKPIVIWYHADCYDGCAAAVIANQFFTRTHSLPLDDVQLVAVQYGSASYPTLPANAELYILDFSLNLDTLKEITRQVDRLLLLDHHPVSEELAREYNAWIAEEGLAAETFAANHCADKSGALMTWEYFYYDRAVPLWIACVSDRDLWQFKLPQTKQLMAGLAAYWLDPYVWLADIDREGGHEAFAGKLLEIGEVAPLIQANHVRWAIENTLRIVDVDWVESDGSYRGAKVPLINCSKAFVSDAAGELASRQEHMFAMAYYDTETHRVFSLRARKDGYDLRHIARYYGGDGHTSAAGFRVPRTHPLAQL